MTATKTLIEKFVLTEDAASVTFSNIPATYKDLQIMISARSSSGDIPNGQADFLYMNLNSINQSSHRYLYGTGSAVGSATSPTRGLGFLTDPNCTANTFSSIEIYIPNYTSADAKSVSATSVSENNATAATMAAHSALFSSVTSAVTSIEFTTEDAGNFVAGSSFYLYGTKASPVAPILAQGTQTLTSTDVTISNYDSNLDYTITTSAGTASRTGNTITVSGLTIEQYIDVTVVAQSSEGYSSEESTITVSSTPKASGGTMVTAGEYIYHTFSSSGTLTVEESTPVQVLLVAGGGGGGSYDNNNYGRGGGGGGAGGLTSYAQILSPGTYSIAVGAGGSGGANAKGGNGTDSSFPSATTAVGGGGGATARSSSLINGNSGGSGGGAATYWGTSTGGSGTAGQGYAGGSNPNSSSNQSAFGGGGGGGGGNGSQPDAGGRGGLGISSYSPWTSATNTGDNGAYVSGGGGGNYSINQTVNAYDGGGGDVITGDYTGRNGQTLTGGGGAGGSRSWGGAGGSGLVVVRRPKSLPAIGGEITISDGYVYHTFNSSQTFITTQELNIEYLVVGGGGSGRVGGPGGGAGGYISSSLANLSAASYTIIVGAGGTQTNSNPVQANKGNDSSISSVTITPAYGGGTGNSGQDPATNTFINGGSGGGGRSGGGGGFTNFPGNGTAGQGYAGGYGYGGLYTANGGGGGASAVGQNGYYSSSRYRGGNGGAGLQWLNGSYYAGGGGGTGDWTAGAGGVGGGGIGATTSSATTYGAPGTAGTGGGGGGGAGSTGNNGGSGVVIIRYAV